MNCNFSRPCLAAFVLAASLTAGDLVSADVLRHPIAPKLERRLQAAISQIDSGDYAAAIAGLNETLAKFPDSGAYALNLLGVAYVKTDQYAAAVAALEQAAALLPHDAMTHYNLGLALICAGEREHAAQAIRRALELDPSNAQFQARLDALVSQ